MARSILGALILLMAALNAGASSELSDTQTNATTLVNNSTVAKMPDENSAPPPIV